MKKRTDKDIQNLLKKYNILPYGPGGLLVKFDNDPKEYAIKNLALDNKHVFVTLNGLQTYSKNLAYLTHVNRREEPILKEEMFGPFRKFEFFEMLARHRKINEQIQNGEEPDPELCKNFISFPIYENVYDLLNEDVDDLHYMEKIQKAYEKELDPFPINLQVTFHLIDDDIYEFDLGETNFGLNVVENNDEEALGWPFFRQTIFEILGGTSHYTNSKSGVFYITSEGLTHIADTHPQTMDGKIGNDMYITFFKNIPAIEELMTTIDTVIIKPYEKYKHIYK